MGRSLIYAAISLAAGLAVPANAAGLDASTSKQIDGFFQALKEGKNESAVNAVLDSSPLWADKTGTKEQMVAQVNTANKIYGPLASYECPLVYKTGTMLTRVYCLAQHKLIVTRWQFDFAKLPTGWAIVYFGFNDQANNWPDGKEQE